MNKCDEDADQGKYNNNKKRATKKNSRLKTKLVKTVLSVPSLLSGLLNFKHDLIKSALESSLSLAFKCVSVAIFLGSLQFYIAVYAVTFTPFFDID